MARHWPDIFGSRSQPPHGPIPKQVAESDDEDVRSVVVPQCLLPDQTGDLCNADPGGIGFVNLKELGKNHGFWALSAMAIREFVEYVDYTVVWQHFFVDAISEFSR